MERTLIGHQTKGGHGHHVLYRRAHEEPVPCRWVESTDENLASVRRFCSKANEFGAGE